MALDLVNGMFGIQKNKYEMGQICLNS